MPIFPPMPPVVRVIFLRFTAFLFCASKYPPFTAGRGDVTPLTFAAAVQPDPGIGSDPT